MGVAVTLMPMGFGSQNPTKKLAGQVELIFGSNVFEN